MTDRYDTSNAPEGQFQPGSNDTVLLNRLGITDKGEMEDVEFDELVRFQLSLFEKLTVDSQISAQILCQWHLDWLGNIYLWAGDYRSVNMSKEGFIFAAAHLIPKLMIDYERDYLEKFTPCNQMNDEELIEAIHAGHAGDYEPMKLLFSDVLEYSIEQSSQTGNDV